jgi:hypothetical protein
MEANSSQRVPGAGWVMFAATLFLILGIFNVIDGIVAISKDGHFAADNLFVGDLTLWGIILMAIGAIQLLASFQLYSGRGQLLGISLLVLNLIAQLFFLPAYPFWSVIVMVICGWAIYGLCVYGDQFTTERVAEGPVEERDEKEDEDAGDDEKSKDD